MKCPKCHFDHSKSILLGAKRGATPFSGLSEYMATCESNRRSAHEQRKRCEANGFLRAVP